MSAWRRHVWCEFVRYDALCAPAVVRALRERAVQPIVAVEPSRLRDAAEMVRALRDGGLPVALWPMLDESDGRWLSRHNVDAYQRFVVRLITALHSRGALPDELVLDLEPPIRGVRALLRGRPRKALKRPPRNGAATSLLQTLVRELEALGVRTSAAILPFAIGNDHARAASGWQRLLGTPIDALEVGRVSTMTYTSLFEGYSRGLLSRADSLAILDALSRATAARYGGRASVSVGCIGVGALGDERVYRSPAELAEDVAIAAAAGVGDVAAFNLGGMLRRPPLERWLDALVAPPAAAPAVPSTWRSRFLLRAWSLAGVLTRADRPLQLPP